MFTNAIQDRVIQLRTEQSAADSGSPIYKQIAGTLRSRIEAGEWKPGELIPTEIELSKLFHASTGTVKKAIQLLVDESLLVRYQGKGTYVSKVNLEGALSVFFRRFVDESGNEYSPLTELTKMEVVPAGSVAGRNLAIPPDAAVVHIERVRTVQSARLMIEHSYFPQVLFPGLEHEDISARLLYQVLEEKYACPVVGADEFLHPSLATGDDAQALGIPTGSPVMVIERFVRSVDGRIIEYRRCVGRGDKYRLHVRLR